MVYITNQSLFLNRRSISKIFKRSFETLPNFRITIIIKTQCLPVSAALVKINKFFQWQWLTSKMCGAVTSWIFPWFFYLWSLIDYGSDIMVGVDYYNKCHYNWAMTTFVISFMPNLIFMLWILHYLFCKFKLLLRNQYLVASTYWHCIWF